jgi:ABC-type Na+ efflux pump permease subunit
MAFLRSFQKGVQKDMWQFFIDSAMKSAETGVAPLPFVLVGMLLGVLLLVILLPFILLPLRRAMKREEKQRAKRRPREE